MAGPRVLVVGDLLYDMLAKTDAGLTLGTDTFAPIRVSAGGSGANAAAWLAHSGVDTRFVGRVGDDVFGRFLEGEMERAGVKSHLTHDPSLATGKVFVLVDGAGERTMITDRGAGEALSPDDLPGSLFTGGHLHLSGYTLSGGSRRETAKKALRLAREAGMTVSVDPSSVPLLEAIGPDRFLEWTRGADLLFPNLPEGETLTGEWDPERILEKLLPYYSAVVLKLGPDGAVYAGADGNHTREPAVPVGVEDTTGAGDAFSAGFLAAWLGGGSPTEALRGGVGLAGRAVGRLGARPTV
ncbi:MAG TPA: sugar kinase [Rubrobacter sp.]|nr:sugar kinase [Rubrobacter sp.]